MHRRRPPIALPARWRPEVKPSRYLGTVARSKINLLVDEELVRRARQQAIEAIGKSDSEIVEEALTAYLAERTLETAGAGSAFDSA